jgi:glycosyltransferase involved in cell wall biosynthesis
MELKIEKSVTVLTPTTGNDKLLKCIQSVHNQTYKNIHHLLVIDGPHHYQKTIDIFEQSRNLNQDEYVRFATLPENTGSNGFYGHRIYAAFPHLINTDYIAFLDEDNWFDENHIESLVNTIEEKQLDFAYSLRKVYVGDEYLADDCCEAIGRWPIAWSDGTQHLVDTSSYCFKREWFINVCQIWHYGWGGDRRFFTFVKHQSNYDTTGLHTLNYNLPDMNKAYGGDIDIFSKYNEIMKQKHNGEYPWKKT